MQILKRGSTNVYRVTAYTDDVTGLPVTNATCTATLFSQAGVAVANATDVSGTYYAASGSIPAQYRGIFPATVLLPNESYDIIATLTNADGVRLFTDTCIVEDG